MRELLSGLLALAFAVSTSAACGSTVPPTPTPQACWVAFIGEYRLTTDGAAGPTSEQLTDTARAIDARLRSTGLAEIAVTIKPPDLIEVALPAMGDSEEVRRLVGAGGDLQFVPVPPGQSVDAGDPLPAGSTALFGREGIASAAVTQDQVGRAAIDLSLTDVASARLDAHAAAHLGAQLAIVNDGIVISAPTLNAPEFGGRLQISGGFDEERDAHRLVTLLRSPPLPVPVEEVSFDAIAPAPGCNAGV